VSKRPEGAGNKTEPFGTLVLLIPD